MSTRTRWRGLVARGIHRFERRLLGGAQAVSLRDAGFGNAMTFFHMEDENLTSRQAAACLGVAIRTLRGLGRRGAAASLSNPRWPSTVSAI